MSARRPKVRYRQGIRFRGARLSDVEARYLRKAASLIDHVFSKLPPLTIDDANTKTADVYRYMANLSMQLRLVAARRP